MLMCILEFIILLKVHLLVSTISNLQNARCKTEVTLLPLPEEVNSLKCNCMESYVQMICTDHPNTTRIVESRILETDCECSTYGRQGKVYKYFWENGKEIDFLGDLGAEVRIR
jgi:hypothetical protein